MGISTLLLLRWLKYEFYVNPKKGKQLDLKIFSQKLGWYQHMIKCHLLNDPFTVIRIQLYRFRKPDLLISPDLISRMPRHLLNVTLLYFCELARTIESNRWLKFCIIFGAVLGFNLIPYLNKTKVQALDHLQNWHGLDAVMVKVRLQQAQYFFSHPKSQLKCEYFKNFPQSLPKGASV